MVFTVRDKRHSAYPHVCGVLVGMRVHLCPRRTPRGLTGAWSVILCVVPITSVAVSPCYGSWGLNSVSINIKIKRMKNGFGLTVLFCIISQAAGWRCCHGDAATEECRRGRGRWQRQEEIQHAQERKICSSGKADQAGSPDRQSRYAWVTDPIAAVLLAAGRSKANSSWKA